ncbi:MAG: hypothetical protein DRN27_03255 [Thermoplasmata archaeon]|nr:MAG: hypothetical protein DRN27_03255 [Thermoplasmata archaeon]
MKKNKITWKYLITKTKFSPETLSKYIKILRRLGILEKKGYVLCDEYKFEPFKIWYKETIMNYPSYNIWSYENSTLLHENISKRDMNDKKIWGEDDQIEFLEAMRKLSITYYDFFKLFNKIGLKKSNALWIEFTKNIDVLDTTKIYFYIKLVEFHYISTQQPIDFCKNKRIRDRIKKGGENKDIVKDATNILFDNITDDEIDIWKSEFKELIKIAFQKIMKRKKVPYSSVFQDELKKYDKEFNELQRNTVIIRSKMSHFSGIIHFPFIGVEEPEIFEKKDLEKAKEIEEYIRDKKGEFKFKEITDDLENKLYKKVQNDISNPDKKKCLINNNVPSKLNFFEEHDFFDGLDESIKNLGYDNKASLYEELKLIANAFKVPKFIF